jgi:hypothetical protein
MNLEELIKKSSGFPRELLISKGDRSMCDHFGERLFDEETEKIILGLLKDGNVFFNCK